MSYEAESAAISGGVVESNHSGFTGTGFVDYDNAVGSAVRFTVTAARAGATTPTFGFANGTTVNRPMDISVNGVVVATGVAFNPTGAWTTWQTKTAAVTLAAGTNTIKATTANGGPNLDYLDLPN